MAGAGVGGFGGPAGLVGAAGLTVAGFGGAEFGSGRTGGIAVGLGARFGALARRGEVGVAGFPVERKLPPFTVWVTVFCVASPPRLALGATAGRRGGPEGGEEPALTEAVSLGGGGLGAGTGAPDGSGSGRVCGFGVMDGFSEVWGGLSSDPGSGFEVQGVDGCAEG